jgi:hypothetical protein
MISRFAGMFGSGGQCLSGIITAAAGLFVDMRIKKKHDSSAGLARGSSPQIIGLEKKNPQKVYWPASSRDTNVNWDDIRGPAGPCPGKGF